MANRGGKAKKVNGYAFPDPLPKGEILKDFLKREWKIGSSIGKGGFGEIYDVTYENDGSKSKKPLYIVKIEPKENGPLFVEKTFYMKVAKEESIDKWIKDKKLKYLGIPKYISSGTHDFKATKYRFLITEKFGEDLYKIFLANNRQIPLPTVLQISLQLIDVLEFLHANGFVHRDIKGTNILVGQPNRVENQVFLIDYGLATRLVTEKEFKPNPKQAHDGTIEYCSRDAHHGVASRRGDFEMLGFNILEWLGNTLPWVKLKNKSAVHEAKNKFIDSMKKSFAELAAVPDVIIKYFEYITSLKHYEEPDYQFIRNFFLNELKSMKVNANQNFFFKPENCSPKKKSGKRTSAEENRNSPSMEGDIIKVKRVRKPKVVNGTPTQSDLDNMEDKVKTPVSKPKTVRKPRKKKSVSPSKKWTNCPTIMASGVVKHGMYVKKQ